jgi:hypothetical protein
MYTIINIRQRIEIYEETKRKNEGGGVVYTFSKR